MKAKTIKYVSLFLMATLVAISSGCDPEALSAASEESPKKMQSEQKLEEVIPVEVISVKIGDISAVHSGSVSLKAENEALVVAQKQGILKSINVEEGDFVTKDQVLATLENRQEQLQYDLEKNRVQELERKLQLSKKLFDKKIISKEEVFDAEMSLKNQKIALDLAKLALEHSSIKASISGHIVKKQVKPGNMVQVYQPIIEISAFSPLYAILHVPETKLSLFKVGLKASLEVDASNSKRFEGIVERISPVVSSQSGTFSLTIRIENRSQELKPGMYARVTITYDTHFQVSLIPREAIKNDSGEDYVFVVNENVAEQKIVKRGFTRKGMVEVAGVGRDSNIVINGFNALKNGSKVKIVK